MSWDLGLLHGHLKTRQFGREITYFSELDSTNRWLLHNHGQFTVSGGVVVADHQTAGRGRLERLWFDVPEKCLLFSILLRPINRIADLSLLNFLPAIALGEYLRDMFGAMHRIELKWPNDVLLNGKKISGVLGQTTGSGARRVTVLGAGVNICGTTSEFPAEIGRHASTIAALTGSVLRREIMLAELLNRMERLYDSIGSNESELLLVRWLEFGPAFGTRIMRREKDGIVVGEFAGIGERGQLLLRDSQGNVRELFSGDIEY